MMFWSWFSSISLSELLWLLVSLQEQLSFLLFIISEKLWIEICWVEGSGIISPLGNVSVIEWSLNLLIMMLFFPLLKLLWHWWISGSLELFDLISIKSSIIKNLPLLWLSLISSNMTFNHLLLTNDFFNPVLEFNKHFLNSWIVFTACNTSVLPDGLNLLVVIIKVHLAWGDTVSNVSHICFLGFKCLP